ncbi:hypothetical protein J6590_101797, partial [Homalodisca vitripennis]
ESSFKNVTSYSSHNVAMVRAMVAMVLMTLPCLYVFEVIVYCRLRCALISGRDVHQYETRGRDNLRTHQRRLTLSQHLPQQVGVGLINKLPEDIKNSNNLNQFKTRLRSLLVSKAFYSVDERLTIGVITRKASCYRIQLNFSSCG